MFGPQADPLTRQPDRARSKTLRDMRTPIITSTLLGLTATALQLCPQVDPPPSPLAPRLPVDPGGAAQTNQAAATRSDRPVSLAFDPRLTISTNQQGKLLLQFH